MGSTIFFFTTLLVLLTPEINSKLSPRGYNVNIVEQSENNENEALSFQNEKDNRDLLFDQNEQTQKQKHNKKGKKSANVVPSVWELAPQSTKEMLLQATPVVQNFWGAVNLRHDLISLGAIALTPFNGNMVSSSLFVDGLPAVSTETRWGICEGNRKGTAGSMQIVNSLRMPFESFSIQQQWSMTSPNAGAHVINILFDGPFFRLCDAPKCGSCGWGTSFPVDRASYSSKLISESHNGLPLTLMTTIDSVSAVVTISAVWFQDSDNVGGHVDIQINQNNTFEVTASFSGKTAVIRQLIATDRDFNSAMKTFNAALGDVSYDNAWNDACNKFNDRWQSAFKRTSKDSHFGGSLPIIRSDHQDIDHLYYWSLMAMISLERTQYPSGPRMYVISQGPSNSLDGSAGMGGSGQFTWDLSFASTSMSLLDPIPTRDVLRYIISASNINPPRGSSISIPEAWDAYIPYNQRGPGGGEYRFDYYTAYLFIYNYVSITNDTSILTDPIPSLSNPGTTVTGLQFIRAITNAWKAFPASRVSPYLVDYGSDKRAYLEVVSTYTDVVPALQAGNAGMSLATSRLLEKFKLGDSQEIEKLRSDAEMILSDMIKYLWNDNDGGVWRCMYGDGTTLPVRNIADQVYVSQALAYLGRNLSLPTQIASSINKFFARELFSSDISWPRALSMKDPLCANVMNPNATIEELLPCRADWGCFGSYGGIPGFSIESTAHLAGDFSSMVQQLQQLSATSYVSAPAQGVAVGTPTYFALHHNGGRNVKDVPKPPFAPAFPEYFDEPGWPLWWPETERYIQNAEASIADVIIRTLFGWRPDWMVGSAPPKSKAAAAIINSSLYLPNVPRSGFNGQLDLIKSPFGYINITANQNGLSWVWAD